MATDEKHDLEDDKVDGVVMVPTKSVSAEIGRVDGGNAEVATESSSE